MVRGGDFSHKIDNFRKSKYTSYLIVAVMLSMCFIVVGFMAVLKKVFDDTDDDFLIYRIESLKPL